MQILNIVKNELEYLNDDIGNLTNIIELDISNNMITKLPVSLSNLILMRKFNYQGNPIEYIPPNVLRFLNKIKNMPSIYEDEQIVHNHAIQECIKKSIEKLLLTKPVITDYMTYIIQDTLFSDKCKELLINYVSDNTIHSVLHLTYADIFIAVINKIEKSDYKDEIKKILCQEILESECKCFTGRIIRLVNSLNGFDNDIVINISDSEQISNIIINVKKMLKNNYNVNDHAKIVEERLTELGYSQQIIDEWTSFILN